MKSKLAIYLIFILMAASSLAPLYYSEETSSTGAVTPLYNATRTKLPGDLPWYFIVVIGDNRPKAVAWVQLPEVFYDSVEEISRINPQALIGLGDHVGQGSRRQYEEFYRVMSDSGIINQMYAMGNHDVSYGKKAWQFWEEYMGPYTIMYDGIPGWRILILDSEGSYGLWNQSLNEAYSTLDGRMMIIAFHRPVKPYVQHNLQDDHKNMAETLLNFLEEYGGTPLVLQAHWHGYAEYHENETSWLIVGSLGAPLYSTSSCEASATCISAYNYLVLILYPNGEYHYIPVLAGKESGNFTIRYMNQTYAIVENSKIDVYGNPVSIPFRIAFEVGGGEHHYQVNIVSIAPPESRGYIGIVEGPSGAKIISNITGDNSYIYIIDEDNGREITVYKGDPSGLNLTEWIPSNGRGVQGTETSSSTTMAQTSPTSLLTSTGVEAAIIISIIVVLLLAGIYLTRR